MKKILAFVCTFALILALIPNVAFANDTDTTTGAKINDTTYESYQAAFAAAQSGDTITLLGDADSDSTTFYVKKSLTVDLNGHTLNVTNANAAFYTASEVTLKVMNGTINSSATTAIWNVGNADVTLSNVTINDSASYNGIYTTAGKMNIVGSTINGKGSKNITIGVQGSSNVTIGEGTTVNGLIFVRGTGTYGQSGSATPTLNVYGTCINDIQPICTNGSDYSQPVINIYDGALVKTTGDDSMTGIYAPNIGQLNIYGGTIQGTGSAIGFKCGELNISGGTLIATGADSTPTEGYSNGINGSGAAIQLESNKSYKINSSTAGVIKVNITGGTIKSENAYAIYEYCNGSDSTQLESLNISGGTFKSAKGTICTSEEFANKDATTVSGGIFSDDYVKDVLANGVALHKTSDGNFAAHSALTKVSAKEADYNEAGNVEYYKCPDCELLFTDAAGTKLTTAKEVTIPALIKVENSTATVSEDAVSNAIIEAADSVVTLPLTETGDKVEAVNLSLNSLNQLKDSNLGVVLPTTNGTITLDKAALDALLDQISSDDTLKEADTIALVVKESDENQLTEEQLKAIDGIDMEGIITLELLVNGKVVASEDLGGFGDGTALVAIPFTAPEGHDGSEYAIFYLDNEGQIEKIDTEYKDGKLVAKLSHFSTYFIAKEDALNTPATENEISKNDNTANTNTTDTTKDAKNAKDAKSTSPKTGDTMALAGLLALCVVSGSVAAITVVRRKKHN